MKRKRDYMGALDEGVEDALDADQLILGAGRRRRVTQAGEERPPTGSDLSAPALD